MIIYISVYIIGKELFWFGENNYMKKKYYYLFNEIL